MHYQAPSALKSTASRFADRLGLRRRGYINCRSGLGGVDPVEEEIRGLINNRMDAAPEQGKGFPLRLAGKGDRVRIVALEGGRGFYDRLAGIGLSVGVDLDVLQNSMCGRMLICRDGARYYLGGGMAQRIQVINIKGGNQ